MKKEILIIGLLLLTGCSDGVVYIKSFDDVHCTLDCKKLMEDNWCDSTYVKFTNYCQCTLLDCLKEVSVEHTPIDYREFKSYSIINSNSECYKNGIEINCSEID